MLASASPSSRASAGPWVACCRGCIPRVFLAPGPWLLPCAGAEVLAGGLPAAVGGKGSRGMGVSCWGSQAKSSLDHSGAVPRASM